MKVARKIKRGAVRRENAVFIGAWVPGPMVSAIDIAINQLDLDRSKFLRRALEEKISSSSGPK